MVIIVHANDDNFNANDSNYYDTNVDNNTDNDKNDNGIV